MEIKTEISKLHYDKNAKGWFFNVLKALSLFYGIGSGLKNRLYDKEIIKPKKVNAFVISVGNMTTGGVGKTPVVSEIANYLTAKGERVAIISRGYGAKLSNENINVISNGSLTGWIVENGKEGTKRTFEAELAGDEPVWLAENSRGVCVLTCKDRYKASKYAIEKFKVTKIILDDGFQHRKLHRDLDIVLIDSEMGFGNENLLPAGPLREGKEAINRIDKLVVVSKNLNHTRAEKYAKIMGKKLKKDTIVCYTEPDFAYNIFAVEKHIESQERVVAFSAIGQPKQFYNFLKPFEVVETVDFDDHHNYTQFDADYLVDCCRENNAEILITTEKDAGKLKNLDFRDIKVFALKLKTKIDVSKLV
ncbi:tetraacyldisaccharide 4'-kinase [bacterium]|nr:tetraacyldisaccharide 4'-kinase [bacterium]